jgi:hypothetical protein
MNEERITESPSWNDPRGQVMKTPADVAEMLRLRGVRVGSEADCAAAGVQRRSHRRRARQGPGGNATAHTHADPGQVADGPRSEEP